jgi:hypothetical protein
MKIKRKVSVVATLAAALGATAARAQNSVSRFSS